MKKVLLSLLTVGAVAVIAVFATQAFFSDVEKSENNRFVAGKLDLVFQHGGDGNWTDVNGNPLFDTSLLNPVNDLKPGDSGEKTVRLWVDNNPACGKVSVRVYEDYDQSCTEPEKEAEGPDVCVEEPTPGMGELNDEVQFLVWEDMSGSGKCDNVMNNGETPLVYGPLTAEYTYGIGELPNLESNAKCYGIAYCFGSWTEDWKCDGSAVRNKSQTDSFKADLVIEALQKRNQFDNGCPTGLWPTPGD